MDFTMDTYAWIEYFEGSKEGEFVKSIVEDGHHSIETPSIVLAELSDAVQRGKVKARWGEIGRFIRINSMISEIDEEIAGLAGETKARMRRKHPDFGLIDGIVLATALRGGSRLLTGDPHLLGEEGVIDIRNPPPLV